MSLDSGQSRCRGSGLGSSPARQWGRRTRVPPCRSRRSRRRCLREFRHRQPRRASASRAARDAALTRSRLTRRPRRCPPRRPTALPSRRRRRRPAWRRADSRMGQRHGWRPLSESTHPTRRGAAWQPHRRAGSPDAKGWKFRSGRHLTPRRACRSPPRHRSGPAPATLEPARPASSRAAPCRRVTASPGNDRDRNEIGRGRRGFAGLLAAPSDRLCRRGEPVQATAHGSEVRNPEAIEARVGA